MKYPNLVRPRFCQTPVTVVIYSEGVNDDGAPEVVFEADLMCNWQDGAKSVLTDKQKRIELSGVALLPGDICPGAAVISGGYVTVFGEKRTIAKGIKARNPDGTVNYTELQVM